MNPSHTLIAITALLGATLLASAQTTIPVVRDATITSNTNPSYSSQSSTNYNLDHIKAEVWSVSGYKVTHRSLLGLDLDAIPAGATISSAKLYLYGNGNHASTSLNGGNRSNAAYLYRVTGSWTETGVTWNTKPSVTGTGKVSLSESTDKWQSYVVTVTTLVKTMLANPGDPRSLMLLLQSESSAYARMSFHSSESTDTTLRPKLVVTFTRNDISYTLTLPVSANYVLTTIPETPMTALPASTASRLANQFDEVVQYVDGLGRPLQTVNVAQSPNAFDVVNPVEYDALGREAIKRLPYEASGLRGSLRSTSTWRTSQPSFYLAALGDSVANTVTTFEASPLNRVLAVRGPGKDWKNFKPNSKAVTYAYGTNSASEVTLWSVDFTTGNLTYQNYYPVGTLHKVQTTDEDGRVSVEFTDLQSRVVMKQTYTGIGKTGSPLVTRYVYDDLGRLRWVCPPELTNRMGTTTLLPSSTNSINYAYYYEYDGRGRIVHKQLPGANPVYIAYDSGDRPVLTQDGELRKTSSWMATCYDALGRPTRTGKVILSGVANTQAAAQTWFNSSGSQLPGLITPSTRFTRTQYDVYPTSTPSHLVYIPRTLNGVSLPAQASSRTVGRVTTTTVKVLNPEPGVRDSLRTFTYYDNRGRVIQVVSESYPRGTIRQSFTYDFRDRPVGDEVLIDGLRENFRMERRISYDHAGRLLLEEHRVDGGTWEAVTSSAYNGLGQLARLGLGGHTPSAALQAVDHLYNIRGWLTSINDPLALDGDLFALSLQYQGGATPQWGGNISALSWRTEPHDKDLAGALHSYAFTYDGANRMLTGTYSRADGINTDMFNESLAYDRNGNITTLTRNDKVNGESPVAVDQLTLVYSGNKLMAVANAYNYSDPKKGYPNVNGSNITRQEFIYDANGNMTRDDNRQLSITYNELNLPNKIMGTNLPDTLISYIYDAAGRKLGARYRKVSTTTGYAYVGPAVYIVSGDSITALEYVGTGYGRLVKDGTLKREYHLRDHLGNVRVTFREGTDGKADAKQVNAYYPFGQAIAALAYSESPDNRLKYNGKELQGFSLNGRSLDWYDYGWRFYDAAVARWHVIDPNVEDNHHNYSPYAYVYNNPIRLIDPFGLDSTQRANAVALAHDYVDKNPGNSYASGRGAPGENTDCSGLVSSCIIKGEESDPYVGKEGNGVSRIAQSSEKVDNNDAEVGNAITLDNSASGKDKPMGHIGIIVEVRKNDDGEVTGFKVVDSGGKPSTGKSGPRYTEITIGGSGYWDNRVTGVYKWDTRPDVYNGGTLKQVTVAGQGSTYIKPIPVTKISVK